MNCKPCIYLVEGQCERKLLTELKNNNLIIPGKIEVFNVLTRRITKSKVTTIKPESIVVMVFDTDQNYDMSILKDNCKILEQYLKKPNIKMLIQVKNLEDELIRSTDIRTIRDLTDSRSNSDFKADFIKSRSCLALLEKHHFDLNKMWKQEPTGSFAELKQWKRY